MRETIAFMLDHGEAKAVIVDPEFAGVMKKAIALRKEQRPLLVIDVEDALYTGRRRAHRQHRLRRLPCRAATRPSPGNCPPTNGMPSR